jgi:GDPmannose 4,6-dehydratase
MGNIDALRDWWHAKDYVRMQWLMLQQDQPEDFVIATGVQHSVRQFIEWSAEGLGVTVRFEGSGVDEVGVVERIEGDKAPAVKVGQTIVRVDPRYFRPTEVESLLGDPTKSRTKLCWKPVVSVSASVWEDKVNSGDTRVREIVDNQLDWGAGQVSTS